ncbi:MAG: hypothetical protein HY457_01920 [Parcubacteria group bacterium]|nr:hypothetical protein [Parcubacteria group bacterium]
MKYLFLLITFLSPFFALAQGRIGQEPQNVGDLVSLFLQILALLIPLILTLALIAFLWGVFRYVIAKGPEDKKEAINVIVWGLIGLFVMVSVWGLVSVLTNTFGIRSGFSFLPTSGGGGGGTFFGGGRGSSQGGTTLNEQELNFDEIPNPPPVFPTSGSENSSSQED